MKIFFSSFLVSLPKQKVMFYNNKMEQEIVLFWYINMASMTLQEKHSSSLQHLRLRVNNFVIQVFKCVSCLLIPVRKRRKWKNKLSQTMQVFKSYFSFKCKQFVDTQWFYKILFRIFSCNICFKFTWSLILTSEFLEDFGIDDEIHLSAVTMLWYPTVVWSPLTVSLFDQELVLEWQFPLQSAKVKQQNVNWIVKCLWFSSLLYACFSLWIISLSLYLLFSAFL